MAGTPNPPGRTGHPPSILRHLGQVAVVQVEKEMRQAGLRFLSPRLLVSCVGDGAALVPS